MLSQLLLVVLLQSPAPRTTPTPDLQRAQKHARTGWTRVDAKDFDAAAQAFEAALQIYPDRSLTSSIRSARFRALASPGR